MHIEAEVKVGDAKRLAKTASAKLTPLRGEVEVAIQQSPSRRRKKQRHGVEGSTSPPARSADEERPTSPAADGHSPEGT
jgi:hypothetical protein